MELEEALAQADVYSTRETEEYCMLESNTSRVVVVPDRYKTFGVEEDTNVERVKFKFPKIVGDNVDLTTLNLRINFQNASGGLDKYVVDDVEEADDGYITFSWVIQDGVTPQIGQISFVVQAVKATADGTVEKKWSTTLNKIGQVLEGLEVDETIEQQNPDIIESILTRLDELEKYGGGGSTPGKDGREVELQNNGTAIQWRYVGDAEWKDLVQLSEITGKSATISVGNVTTGEAGTQASVQNTGTESNAIFDFTIPRGTDGSDGITPNIQIGEVTTLEPGQQATASVTGSKENPLLNLGIPRGQDGSGGGSTEEWELLKEITLEEDTAYINEKLDGEYKSIILFFENILSSNQNSISVIISFNGNIPSTQSVYTQSRNFVQNNANFKSSGFFKADILPDGSCIVFSAGQNSSANRGTGGNDVSHMTKAQMNYKNYIEEVSFSLNSYSTNQMVSGASIQIYGR